MGRKAKGRRERGRPKGRVRGKRKGREDKERREKEGKERSATKNLQAALAVQHCSVELPLNWLMGLLVLVKEV